MGYQLSLWRMSPHAQAYAVLSTPKAAELAKKAGVDEPQKAPECLKCHVTAGAPGTPFASTFDVREEFLFGSSVVNLFLRTGHLEEKSVPSVFFIISCFGMPV